MSEAGGAIEAAFRGSLGAFSLDVRFSAPMRGVTALFGASGSGKTTILRCVAGLQRLAGRLVVGDELWHDDASATFRPPHRRPIGYVFQEASLFPHLSVRNNLLFGARRAAPGDPAAIDFGAAVELLGIGHLLERSPTSLSGGERQRVAVGRALLSRPRLLLMDEPLSSLDRIAKEEILPYFEALHRTLSVPVLYVSHDIAEIERLADTLVLIEGGRVVASGALVALEANPALPLLRAPDAAVTLEGEVVDFDEAYGLTTLSVRGHRIIVPGRRGRTGTSHRLRIAASDVSFARSRAVDSTVLNALQARILSIEPQDDQRTQVNVVAGLGENGDGPSIVGRVTRRSLEALDLKAGTLVYAQIKSVALVRTSS